MWAGGGWGRNARRSSIIIECVLTEIGNTNDHSQCGKGHVS